MKDSGVCFQTRRIMRLLLLLGFCFCLGLTYDVEDYGNALRLRIQRRAYSIEFTSEQDLSVTVLWKRYDHSDSENRRGHMVDSNFVIYNLTQQDSGRYIMRDKDRLALYVKNIRVKENTMNFLKEAGETFTFSFNLEPDSCNIYFHPANKYYSEDIEIVRKGQMNYWNELDCKGFKLVKSCGLRNENILPSCSGRFEIRDSNGNVALDVSLEMESSTYETSEIGVSIGVFFIILSCCTCVKRCCCGKSSTKKDEPESPVDEPAPHYQENDSRPVQPSAGLLGPSPRTHRPAPPSYTPTEPLIHYPPTIAPPPYFEVSAPADAPTPPAPSDPGPRFELKGMTFPSANPLGSDSTSGDVYTSDKLNFL